MPASPENIAKRDEKLFARYEELKSEIREFKPELLNYIPLKYYYVNLADEFFMDFMSVYQLFCRHNKRRK